MSEKKRGDMLRGAMSGLSEKTVAEAFAYTPGKGKTRRRAKIISVILAAALLLTSVPLGVIIIANRKNANDYPDPEPIVFSGGRYSGSGAGLPDELKTVSITADGTDSRVIPIDGSFIIETAGPTGTGTLAGYLTMTPAIATSVTKLSDNRFRVSPASGSLEPGQIYRITLGDPENPAASYAFQTENGMKVKSVFPADLSLNVPRDTGIEVAFTDSVVLDGKKDPFTVSPAVSGKFSLYPDGRTVLFLPDSDLDYDTVYTVTVSEGVAGRSGKTFEGECSAKFRTVTKEYEKSLNSSSSDFLRISYVRNRDYIFSPGCSAGLDFYVFSPAGTNLTVSCDLYAFASAAQAAGMAAESERHAGDNGGSRFDVSKLTKAGTFKATGSSATHSYSLDFGSGLPEGVYLAKITATYGRKTAVETVFIQISELRPYTVSSDGSTYLWLNRTGSGRVAGAKVTACVFDRYDGWNSEINDRTLSSVTGSDGLCRIDNGGRNSAIIYAESDGDAVILFASLAKTDANDYYMNCFFTDREVYFSDDTVNFSGFIANSFGGDIPDHLYLSTGLSSLKERIEVDENGFFKGSFSYEKTGSGYFSLRLCDGDGRTVAAKGFRVTEEEKPQYTASVSFDRLFYRRNEKIKVTVKATFFDGTPADGLEFSCRMSYFGENSRTVKTDKKGEATLTFTPRRLSYDEVYGTDPVRLWFRAELTGFETQTLRTSASVLYFHSDYAVGTSQNETESVMTLNARDTSGIKSASDLSYPAFPENTVGKALSKANALSWTLVKTVITRTEHKEYNSYTRRNETYFNYSSKDYTVDSGVRSFVNGKASFPLKTVEGFTGYYTYKVSFYDETSENTYSYSLSGTAGRRYYTNSDWENPLKVTLNAESYSAGDRVEAGFESAYTADRVLFVTAARGIADIRCADSLSFSYTNDMIAAGNVSAVLFDSESGNYYIAEKRLPFDTAAASLVPEIIPSAEKYRPGDQATVTVRVPGVSGGFAVLSVVDEACFALGDQKIDPLNFFSSSSSSSPSSGAARYYDYLSYYYIKPGYRVYGNPAPQILFNTRFATSLAAEASGADRYRYAKSSLEDDGIEIAAADAPAEAESSTEGSGDGWYVRKYFADNPEYRVVELGSDGCGTLVFTVPDNITSWRITALAVSGTGGEIGEIRTGAGVSDVICTQPFFINLGICDKYIVGDTVSLSARAYGTEASGNVKYTAVLSDALGNRIAEKTGSSQPTDRCWLKFDLDTPGRYRVTVYGECGDNRDALTADFDLVTTAVAADISKTLTVGELGQIDPVYWPVRLVFSNRTESCTFYERIASYLSYSRRSGRTDESAARLVASAARERLYGLDGSETEEEMLRLVEANFSYADGQFRLFTYSEADPGLTASVFSLGLPLTSGIRTRAATVAAAAVASNKQESPEALCENLCILASLGEPVLDTLYAVASTAGKYPDEAKLRLALAFALCGDWPAASDIYSQVRDAIGTEDREYGTLRFGKSDFDTNVSLTSLALLCAARVARDDAARLARWLAENPDDSVSDRIALASYLMFFLPAETAEPVEFTYSVGAGTERVKIETGRSFTLLLSAPELAAFETSLPDDFPVGVSYRGTAEEAMAGAEKYDGGRVTVTKKMYQNSRGNCTVELNISGTSTRVSEYFELYDLIPSGARFLSIESRGYGYNTAVAQNGGKVYTSAYLCNRSGQNMTGGVSVYNDINAGKKGKYMTECPEYSFSVTVSYVIRGAVDGRFIAESAFLKNSSTGVFSVSDRMTVDIRENGAWNFGG